jgi:hypothetical protein
MADIGSVARIIEPRRSITGHLVIDARTIMSVSIQAPDPGAAPDDEAPAHPTAELDIIEAGGSTRRRRAEQPPHPRPPQVRLGTIAEGGLAPAILAIVERGVRRRPALANALVAEIELAMDEEYPPVRIVFGERLVLVEDGPGVAPDIRVEGSLPDLISLMVTPLVGGVPNPIDARGRAALGKVALGRVRVEGRISVMRRLLGVIRV